MANGFTKREMGQAILLMAMALLIALLWLTAKGRRADAPIASPQHADAVIAEERDTILVTAPQLHPFDPNTVNYEELIAMGISRREAVSLLKFRATGKLFRIREDVALCYGITDSAYQVLKPYIKIGEAYRIQPHAHHDGQYDRKAEDSTTYITPTPFRIDTVSARYLRAIGAFTKRQAEAFIRWRDRSGMRDMEEVRACYVVDDSVATALEPFIIFPERDLSPFEAPVDINTADSSRLVEVVGIGPKTAHAIIRYRERLGGFVRVEQLAEVRGVLERNYEKILQQICCKDVEIQKIDINFATPSELDHPYIGPKLVRKIVKQRQLKGGWTCTQELVETNILTKEEAERLNPYLVFGVQRAESE